MRLSFLFEGLSFSTEWRMKYKMIQRKIKRTSSTSPCKWSSKWFPVNTNIHFWSFVLNLSVTIIVREDRKFIYLNICVFVCNILTVVRLTALIILLQGMVMIIWSWHRMLTRFPRIMKLDALLEKQRLNSLLVAFFFASPLMGSFPYSTFSGILILYCVISQEASTYLLLIPTIFPRGIQEFEQFVM